ncbi:hypothetical protein BDR26DRAFT_850580 [Obelidium mucronatum]|nr:hypothetical protein BDR26DRAFT_850580 [Obelidium mucronatum]
MDHWDDHLALALLLMHAKACPDATPYSPYIDTVPRAFSNLLCLEISNPRALDRLKGTLVEAVMENERSQMELVLVHVLMPLVKLFPGVLLKDSEEDDDEVLQNRLWAELMWAHAAIASRAFTFRLEKSDEQSEVFMVPYLDLANHSNTPNLVVKGVDAETKSLIIKSKKPIEAGQEVTIAYHDSSVPNWFLLTHYGFAIEGNPEETVNVTFDDGNQEDDVEAMRLKERKDGLLAVAAEVLALSLGRDQEFGPVPPSQGIVALTPEEAGIPQTMIMSLRVLVANQEDLESINKDNIAQRITSPLSDENEAKVFEMVDLMAQTLLGMYVTTLESDLERKKELMLQPVSGVSDERYILDYLIGQKQILAAVISYCASRS